MGIGRRVFATVTALAFILPLTSSGLDARGDINFFLGQKKLADDSLEPLDRQFEFGTQMSFGGEKWPVAIAVDIMLSADAESVNVDYYDYYYYGYYSYDGYIVAATAEIDVGVRKTWEFDTNPIRPYVGGGLGIMSGAVVLTDDDGDEIESDSDATVGFWAGGGVFWRLGSKFNLGLSLRYSKAELDLSKVSLEKKTDVGGFHAGLLLGWGW